MQTPPRSLAARAGLTVAGTSLLAVGTAGLFLPIIPGVVLVASGLAILGRQYGWARTALDRVTPARFKQDETSKAEAA
ncbi:MAG TPA: PGPGW domain-containing protein [Acidimicrobiia bacterium]|nr:PGPGW domain-containing protein [Acidimicrobiia bacterium]